MTATDAYGVPSHVRITQIRSGTGNDPKARGTLKALGLRKVGSSKIHVFDPTKRGMIRKVRHLVRVEPVAAALIGPPSALVEKPSMAEKGGRRPRPARVWSVEPPSGPDLSGGPRLEAVESDEDGMFLNFLTGKALASVERAIFGLVDHIPDSRSVTLRWDTADGVLREYRVQPALREQASRSERLAFLRVDVPGLTISIEPSLLGDVRNTEVLMLIQPEKTEQAVTAVAALAGSDVAQVLTKRLPSRKELDLVEEEDED